MEYINKDSIVETQEKTKNSVILNYAEAISKRKYNNTISLGKIKEKQKGE